VIIRYNAVRELMIDSGLAPKSFEGIKNECELFHESLQTAEEIEDYSFLDQWVTKFKSNQDSYEFFWDYRHHHPTTLIRGEEFTISSLVALAHDHQANISLVSVRELISNAQDLNKVDDFQVDYVAEFDVVYDAYSKFFNLLTHNIRRNDPCPCGSTKKYKLCHGLKTGAKGK
jgi:hypothetical protein